MYVYIHSQDVHSGTLGTEPKTSQRGILQVAYESWKLVTCKVEVVFSTLSQNFPLFLTNQSKQVLQQKFWTGTELYQEQKNHSVRWF